MLEVRKLSAGYGGEDVLREVDLRFLPGTLTAVVGKNGCGKSTLLKACAGLLAPRGGQILLQGRALADYESRERAKRISYLAQWGGIPAITVERFVMHGRHPHLGYPKRPGREDLEAVERAMIQMGVADFRHKHMGQLSGGERQRVYLAMHLAQDAPVMLLDEPTTYMDLGHQLEFLDLLGQLKKDGKCIVMVLHDLQQVLRCSDRIVAMENGRILCADAPQQLLESGALADLFGVDITAVDGGEQGMGYLFAVR